MHSRITRRQALRLAMASAIAAGGGYLFATRDHLTVAPAVLRRIALRATGGSTPVAVVACPSYAEAEAALRRAWGLLGNPDVAGKRVVLKPNLVDYVPGRPAHTAPAVLVAAIRVLRDHGAASVVVADGPAFDRDAEELLFASGLGAALAGEGVPFVDLNYDDLVKVETGAGYGKLRQLLLPRTVVEADILISVPKLKTHHWTWVSLSMKNLFGVVPGGKYGWPKNLLHVNGLSPSIATLYEALVPRLAIVDGVLGMQGDGPVLGDPRDGGVLVMGTDLVAVDATCARIMGFPAEQIRHLTLAEQLGLGRLAPEQIAIRGDAIADVARQFVAPPFNLGQST